MKTNLLTKCICHCADGQISKDMGGLLQEDGRDFLFYFVGEVYTQQAIDCCACPFVVTETALQGKKMP